MLLTNFQTYRKGKETNLSGRKLNVIEWLFQNGRKTKNFGIFLVLPEGKWYLNIRSITTTYLLLFYYKCNTLLQLYSLFFSKMFTSSFGAHFKMQLRTYNSPSELLSAQFAKCYFSICCLSRNKNILTYKKVMIWNNYITFFDLLTKFCPTYSKYDI